MPASPFPCSPNPQPPSRRTRVPPALTRGPEAMPALGIIDEVSGDLGVVLWRSARDVALWAGTPPGRRGGLFAGSAAARRGAELQRLQVDAELVAPLSVMARMLECPAGMDVVRLVHACRRISAWAEQRGMLSTALEFLQAAAQAAPESAGLAYGVGRLARRRAEYDRAESWYGRAIVQARRSEDWRTYALAYSGLGNLNVQKGNFPAARRAQKRCLSTALRHGLVDVQAIGYHDLFLTQLETGGGVGTAELAASALRAYGPGHPYLPRLSFDLGYHLILQGDFESAFQIAKELPPFFEGSSERALVFSQITRSAGGAGNRAAFFAAYEQLRDLLASGAGGDASARALLGVSYGATSLCEWEIAERTVGEALEIARERREGRLIMAAEAALQSIHLRTASPATQSPAGSTEYSDLAREFVSALQGRGAMVGAGT